jgi:hypothetical protein
MQKTWSGASRCRAALTRDLLFCADMYPGFVGASHALRGKQGACFPCTSDSQRPPDLTAA